MVNKTCLNVVKETFKTENINLNFVEIGKLKRISKVKKLKVYGSIVNLQLAEKLLKDVCDIDELELNLIDFEGKESINNCYNKNKQTNCFSN